MAQLLPPISIWLADYHLLAAALLLGVTIAMALLRQPAQRLALANASLAALAAMFLLTALPGWSLVHLFSEPAPAPPVATTPESGATTAVAMPSPFELPAEAFPPTAVVPNAPAPASPPIVVAAPPATPGNWLALLLVAYAAGSAAVIVWLIIGAILAGRVRRQAAPAPAELQELLRQVCGEGKTPPQLLLSPHIAAPAALGLRRPAIILPASSPSPIPHSAFPISPAQLLPILAHEWAHLQHRDLHTLAASRLLLVLLWPQPLFWLLRRTIRLDQEALADAAAADRAGRLDYAQQLLAWARTANTQRPPRLAGAVGLWEGPSQLKRRIALLLNEQFAVMQSCSRRWRGGSLVAIALVTMGLSTVTLQPQAGSANEASVEMAVIESPSSAKGAPALAPAAAQPADVTIDWTDRYEEAGPAEPNVYAGLCVDEHGQPLAGVDVSLFVYENFELGNPPAENREPVVVTHTDAAGRFRFENVAELAKDRAADAVSKQIAVIAQAPGRVIGGSLESVDSIATRGKTSRLPMHPASSFTGRVTDVSGHPIANAIVATGWGYLIPNSGLLTRTDAEGRYRLDAMPPATPAVPASVIVTHPNYVAKFAKHSSNSTDFDVQLRHGSILSGRVVYKSADRNVNPVPVAGVRVWAAGSSPVIAEDEADGKRIAVTDADGRYELRGLVGGTYALNATAPGRVTAGLSGVEVANQALPMEPGRTVEVPDMVLTDGAIVRMKFVEGATGKPLPLRKGTNAFVTPRRIGHDELPYALRIPSPVDEQAEAEVRLPAGQYSFFTLIPAVVPESGWTSASDKVMTPDGETTSIELAEGETVDITIPMARHNPSDWHQPMNVPPPSLTVEIPSLSPYYAPQPAGVGASVAPMPLGAVPTAPPTTTAAPLQVGATIQPPLPAQAAPLQAAAAADAIMIARGVNPRPNAVEPNVIQGRCVNEQEKPLADVTVDLYRSDPGGSAPHTLVASTKTNAQGEYRFDDVVDIAKIYPNGRIPTAPQPGAPMFVWIARQPGRVSRESAAFESQAALRGQTIDLIMPAAMSLTGVVRNAAGQPIAGALIARRARMAIVSDYATARSDAEGKFAVNDLPAYDMQVEVERQLAQNQRSGFLPTTEGVVSSLVFSPDAQLFRVTHPDYQFKNLPLGDVPAEIEIVLEPAARIAGRVVLPDGAPAAGVNVLVQNSLPKKGDWGMIDYQQYKLDSEYEAYAKTDSDGRFELKSLQPGKFDVWVEAPGWLNAGQGEVVVTAGETASVPDLELTKGGTIKVQALYSATKEPLNHIAGAQAVARVLMKDEIGRQQPVEQRVPLAADGTFTLASLPGTAMVRLEAITVDDEVRWIPASNEFDDMVIVEVAVGETVEAKLPVKEVASPPAFYQPVAPQGQSASDATWQLVPAVAPAGSPVPSTTGAQVPPASGTASATIETRHQSIGQAKVVAVPLEPTDPSTENANQLEINVVDEQGAPLAGVEALIYGAPPHNAPGKPVLLRTLATDAEGTLFVSDLVSAEEAARFQKIKADGGFLGGLEGGFLVALRRPGLATAAIFQAAGPLALYGANRTIKMHPAVKLSGQVTDLAGKPVAGATVIAGGDLFSGTAIEGVNAAVTDADGRYEFADRAAFNRAEANKLRNQSLTMATAALDLKTSPPAAAAPPAEDPSVNSVSDLLVSHPDFAVTRVEGGDVPGVVDIQLLPPASITGRVLRDGSGAPVAGVIVHADEFPDARQIEPALEFRPHHAAVTTTDASGAYRIANLPAGRYDVWADSGAREMSNAPWVSRGHPRINVSPGDEPTQVPDLVIGPPAAVQVQLVDAESGNPVGLPAGANVTIAAESIDGPRLQHIPQQRVAATTDGKFDMGLLPGRSRLLIFVNEGRLGSPAIWQSDDDVHSTGKVFDVQAGETISATIEVLPISRVNEFRERDMAANKLMEEKKYAEAIAAYTALIADFPKNHFRVLQQRAHAYNRLGNYAAALADFEASLKQAPDNAGTKFWIAQLLATTPVDADRDSRRALAYADQLAADARARGEDQQWLAAVLDTQAAAHADLGDFAKAIKIEKEAIQLCHPSQRKKMESRLELYEAKKPYRLSSPAP